jgi:transcriptional regulator with XRE-family HTH domain
MPHGCATIKPRMADPNTQLSLRERWKLARQHANLSQTKAASQMGVERGSIARMEEGKTPVTPPYVLWAIVVWGTPREVLDVADLGQVGQGEPGQRLRNLAHSRLALPPDGNRREEDSAEGTSQ